MSKKISCGLLYIILCMLADSAAAQMSDVEAELKEECASDASFFKRPWTEMVVRSYAESGNPLHHEDASRTTAISPDERQCFFSRLWRDNRLQKRFLNACRGNKASRTVNVGTCLQEIEGKIVAHRKELFYAEIQKERALLKEKAVLAYESWGRPLGLEFAFFNPSASWHFDDATSSLTLAGDITMRGFLEESGYLDFDLGASWTEERLIVVSIDPNTGDTTTETPATSISSLKTNLRWVPGRLSATPYRRHKVGPLGLFLHLDKSWGDGPMVDLHYGGGVGLGTASTPAQANPNQNSEIRIQGTNDSVQFLVGWWMANIHVVCTDDTEKEFMTYGPFALLQFTPVDSWEIATQVFGWPIKDNDWTPSYGILSVSSTVYLGGASLIMSYRRTITDRRDSHAPTSNEFDLSIRGNFPF